VGLTPICHELVSQGIMSNRKVPLPTGFSLRHRLRGHERAIYKVAWSPDGRMLVSGGSHEGTVRIWDCDIGEQVKVLDVPKRTFGVSWSPDGRTIATAHDTGSIYLWEAPSGKLLDKFRATTRRATDVGWSKNGKIFTAATDSGYFIWSTDKFYSSARPLLVSSRTRAIPFSSRTMYPVFACSPDGEEIVIVSENNSLSIYDIKQDISRLELRDTSIKSHIKSLAWSPDGHTIASATADGAIQLWESYMGRLISVLEVHTDRVISIIFSDDGSLFASKSMDGTVRIWRCDTWAVIGILKDYSPGDWCRGLAFNPGSNALAILGRKSKDIFVIDYDLQTILANAPSVEAVHYTTAKVALVGDSGVGKTGLGWRLSHGEYKEHSSTHGQQFWVLPELGITRADGTECEAILWDLAGQPDYRLIHALFLDDVDLALVLFDPTNRQDPLKGVEYWLKQLTSSRAKASRIILVGARIDRGTPTLTIEELAEFCRHHNISGYVGTSALSEEGLNELLEKLKSEIKWELMSTTITTLTFKKIKEFVLVLKERVDEHHLLLTPDELSTRLRADDPSWTFSHDEMMTAVKHLTNHGYVTVLRRSTGDEVILLTPDLLINLASSIVLEARRNPKGLGALEEAKLLRGEYSFPETNGLSEKEVLLDAAAILFIEHNICFRESLGTQTLLVFPSLINQKRPLIDNVETIDDVSYSVTGAVENVYAALVVLLGYTNTFVRTNQWQNQAQYETEPGEICGFRQTAEREGEIELTIYYGPLTKPHTRLLFQGLVESFLDGRDVRVKKYPPVVCPECGYRQERIAVVNRFRASKSFLHCGDCGESISLPAQDEEIVLSRRDSERVSRERWLTHLRTTFEAAVVRVKTIVRDTSPSLVTPGCFISYAWGMPEHERWVSRFANDLRNAGIDVIIDQKDNATIGSSIPRFISRIGDKGLAIIVVGTTLYRKKYENKLSTTGSVVAAEVDLINIRLTGTEEDKASVLPILIEGEPETSLPPLLQRRVFGDFRHEDDYFHVLFTLILTLYKIPFQYPGIDGLYESLARHGDELLIH
jgi:small GTP-binding protein